MTGLKDLEQSVDGSGAAGRIEALLPSGARRRQLRVRTLLLGMLLALADGRPAHLECVRNFVRGGDRNQCFRRSLGVA